MDNRVEFAFYTMLVELLNGMSVVECRSNWSQISRKLRSVARLGRSFWLRSFHRSRLWHKSHAKFLVYEELAGMSLPAMNRTTSTHPDIELCIRSWLHIHFRWPTDCWSACARRWPTVLCSASYSYGPYLVTCGRCSIETERFGCMRCWRRQVCLIRTRIDTCAKRMRRIPTIVSM